jgi:hypothetical protein
MASASAASGPTGSAPGSCIRTMWSICRLSAWPAPTTAFLMALGAYSATGIPAAAGTSIATPRACPSFSVPAPSRLTKVISIAAASGAWRATTAVNWRAATGAVATGHRHRTGIAVRHVAQAAAVDIDDPPAEAPQARIDSDDAHALPRSRLPVPALVFRRPFQGPRRPLGTTR